MRWAVGVVALASASALGACLFPNLGALSGDASVTPADASSDVLGDANTRIKNITFENGLAVDPISGVDSVNNPIVVYDGGLALSGLYSAATKLGPLDAASPESALIQGFNAPARLFITMLIRVDAVPAVTARFFKIGSNQTTFESYIVPNGASAFIIRSKIRLTTASTNDKTLGDSPSFPIASIVRVGLELDQQSSADAGDGVANVYAVAGPSAFGAPFASSNQETLLGPSDQVILGASTSSFVSMTIDDVFIDTGSMPAP